MLSVNKRAPILQAMLLAALFLLLNTAKSQDVQQLINAVRSAQDVKVKGKLLENLAAIRPQSTADVEAWIRIARTANDKDVKRALLLALQNVGEKDAQFTPVYIKALGDRDRDVRVAAMVAVVNLKATAAAPILRKKVKDFNRAEYLAIQAVALVNPMKAADMMTEVIAAIGALGEMKDEASIPLLVNKFDYLGEFVNMPLAKIGKKALPSIVELARKDKDVHQYYGKWALSNIEDKEAKGDLMNLVRNEADREIRKNALASLTRFMFDDDVLDMVQELYSKERNGIFISAMKSKKAVPFLIKIMGDEYDSPNRRGYAASVLGDIKDPSAIPALEEAFKNGDGNLGCDAADALHKITGKDYVWVNKK